MANAVLVTKVNPKYDDLPEERYHFPRTYLNAMERAVGDWIVYYEPGRTDDSDRSRHGRKAYFATARVTAVSPDPERADHYYAHIAHYTEFAYPVPFKTEAGHYYESRGRKADGTTNRGLFGRAVRLLGLAEYMDIVQEGFAEALGETTFAPDAYSIAGEPEPAYGRKVATELVNRKVRDAAFAQVVRDAYDSTCAFTGLKLINGGGHCEIEAAHILPVAEHGPDSPRNGLALSRTMHWMFDRGILSLEDDGRILMAERLVPDPVHRIINPDGYALRPHYDRTLPHRRFLKWHRDCRFKG